MLHRYWFRFSPSDCESILDMGCGITAYNQEDATGILHKEVFSVYGVREIIEVILDVDIRTLEGNHVRNNMGVPVWRGVWFPLI